MTRWTSSTSSASVPPAMRFLILPADRRASLFAGTIVSDTWSPGRPHLDLIGELFGCDIALYPAHLATLNLAAREINDEANYPRIARRNFFDFAPPRHFATFPTVTAGNEPIPLPRLDAVVGNPPYVRQEKVEKKDKARFGQICSEAWPGSALDGRSDLHCYFWPRGDAAAESRAAISAS